MSSGTYKDAARQILAEAGTPLHAHEIARRALETGLVVTSGKTPEATMEAALCVAVRSRDAAFVRVTPRTFALRTVFAAPGAVEVLGTDADAGGSIAGERRIRIPHFPTYTELRAFLTAAAGLTADAVAHLRGTLTELRGTPQSQTDWSEPDVWIGERVSGKDAATAKSIWEGSGRLVNPRHTTGVWLAARNYDLLNEGAGGKLVVSARGAGLLARKPEVVRDIDDAEGLLAILQLVAELGPAGTGDLLGPWGEHLQRHGRVKSDSATRSYLYQRLRNLLDRELVARSGARYAVTPAGLAWLGSVDAADATEADPNAELLALAQRKQEQVREALREILFDMDPYAFEHVIKDLLVAMGYDEVEVTAPSNDKGVDVIGRIQLGITAVREVIQVKRHRRTIQRKDLDALRGCLHRFQAVRGTLITTSRFSSGTEKAAFEFGAAPITLIDGDKLIDLLAANDIGVKKRKVDVWELDESAFAEEES
jgi:restriction system protein